MPENEFDRSRQQIREAVLNLASVALGRAVGLFEIAHEQSTEEVAITQESWAQFEPFCQLIRSDPRRAADCDRDHLIRASPHEQPLRGPCLTCHAGVQNVRVFVREGDTTLVLIGGQFRVTDDPELQAESEKHFRDALARYQISGQSADDLLDRWQGIPEITHAVLSARLDQVQKILRDYARINAELGKMKRMLERIQIDIAHEFATLAEPIRRNVEYLYDRSAESSARERKASQPVLVELADQIDSLTDALIIHLPDYYNFKFTPRHDNMQRVIRRCVNVYRGRAERRQIRMRLELDREPKEWITISALHIEAALRNVIENAVKYSYRGAEQRPREILIQGRLLDNGYQLMVENYGVGIDEDELDRVFEPGYQGRHKAAESVTGSGMGLSLVKEYIQWHAGRVWATSQRVGEGRGSAPRIPYLTQMWIYLPAHLPEA